MGFKDKLGDLIAAIDDASQEAAGLENKHLSDVIAQAARTLADAQKHPDADKLDAPPEAPKDPSLTGPVSDAPGAPVPGASTGGSGPLDPPPPQPTPFPGVA